VSGETAVYVRRAARILLTDGEDRVLLFRYTPGNMPAFWLLPGGECDPYEDFPEAARRELFEETGIHAEPDAIGVKREMRYEFEGTPVHGIEHFFRHRVETAEIDTSGHTALERERMLEHRWFTLAELRAWHEPVWPQDIPHLLGSNR
jgi:8-oxo-dGTP pyrophosphatase MutT (NUDIX family)